jgi:SNF2 family DNA or RNA helicase
MRIFSKAPCFVELILMKLKSLLHDYQINCINKIKSVKRCALHLDMGCGKTIITLTAISDLLNEKLINRVLIIAPLQVAKNVWHNELLKWEHTKNITYSLCFGAKAKRDKALKELAQIYIINRELVSDLSNYLYQKIISDFDMIIIDESSGFKNHKSKRFKSLSKMKCDYLVELTGTPSPNGLLDLWSQIYLLDKGERFEKSMSKFISKNFNYKTQQNKFSNSFFFYDCFPKNEKELFNKISDIAFSLKASDYIVLPKRIDLITQVELQNQKQYKELEKEFILKIKENTLIAPTVAVLFNKLLQFCNGAIYDENKNIIELNDDKLDALENIIENNPNENFLVAYNFKSDLIRLKKRFKYSEILSSNNGSIIEKWNRREIKLLLCHPASSSMGLNLQCGGNIIIWFGMTWNLEHYLQFNARLHRQGQEKPVKINHLLAKNCIDEKIYIALQNKNLTQESLLKSLIL